MLNTILGQKGNMDQVFVEGKRIGITRLKAGPCVVTQVKKMDTDGYWSVQLGFGSRRIKNTPKPQQGHFKGAIQDNKAPRFIKEVRMSQEPDLHVGDQVKVTDIFGAGDIVTVMGTSKGKGFAGVVKRWGFAGGPKTHGQSDRHRAPGSIGQGTTPGRVLKGKKMAGRMGSDRVTVKSLEVISVNPETNEIDIKGSVPGITGGLVIITKTKEGERKVPEAEAQPTEEVQEEAPVEVKEEVKAEAGAQEPQEEVKEEKSEEQENA